MRQKPRSQQPSIRLDIDSFLNLLWLCVYFRFVLVHVLFQTVMLANIERGYSKTACQSSDAFHCVNTAGCSRDTSRGCGGELSRSSGLLSPERKSVPRSASVVCHDPSLSVLF